MNKVLLICNNFPPVCNGGTIRCEKMVKYLPEFGWETVVLTKKPLETHKLDFSINLRYCKVYRTNSFDIVTIFFRFKTSLINFVSRTLRAREKTELTKVNFTKQSSVKRRISEYFLVPDSDLFWAIGAMIKGLIISKKEKPHIILSSGPSHSSHLIALFLKKSTKIKWVVEFRDPWTMNPFNITKPFKILTKLDNYLEKIVLKNADKINVTSLHYKNQFLNKYNFITKEKIVCIPNGFDSADFMNKLCNKNKNFTIVHSGSFYQHRSSEKFMDAIIYLLENELIDKNDIEVKFIGGIDEKGKYMINNSEFQKYFVLSGQVPHQESINEILNADLLLLIPGPGEGTMPGKFYEYLAASKPIFCITNEGPAKDLIIKHNLGKVVNNNKTEIAESLKLFIEEILEGKFIYPNVDKLKKEFNRKDIACQMANVLDIEIKS